MSAQHPQREAGGIPVFADFVPEIVDRLQAVTDKYLEEFNEHQAFVYLVAELFETTDEDRFTFTDGAKDGGIDFFVQDIQSYSIYQCKCPKLETLESSQLPPAFDKAAVHEVIAAVRFLKDSKGIYDVKKEVARLRTDFQRDLATDPQSTICRATLAILGKLTPAAWEVFEAERQALQKERIVLRLITWRDIYRALHEMEMPADLDVGIDLYFDDAERELLRHRDYCYILAHAVDFYDAWRQHGWNL